ncbi:hypothetical protein WA026_018310 [Henosepilachna vigintioctopunctata]|uniref:Lipase domain-containing protein n=1 Tax=Henosepilachna vigintioctopunctata TaxID=420089 RepID=A0AAW1V8S0_9CUCU
MKCLKIFENTILLTFLCTIVSAQKSLDSIEDFAYEAIKWIVEGVAELTGQPVNRSDVTFYLKTSKDDNSTNHFIDPENPTQMALAKGKIYFFIHGWTQSRESTPWYSPLTETLLKRYSDAFIVQVDWSRPAGENYPFASFTTERIGIIIGDFIFKVVKDYRIPFTNVIIIGHSLGAHVSSWTCKRFYELSGLKLPRLIALDPAGPLFLTRPKDRRLNANDAQYVTVVHTDITIFGYPTDIGTLDFYPNSGMNQPGCKLDWTNSTSLTKDLFCSHTRAFEFFLHAVRNPQFFMAKRCPSYEDFKNEKCDNIEVSLGDLETTQRGDFFLDTDAQPPYFHTSEQNATRAN